MKDFAVLKCQSVMFWVWTVAPASLAGKGSKTTID